MCEGFRAKLPKLAKKIISMYYAHNAGEVHAWISETDGWHSGDGYSYW